MQTEINWNATQDSAVSAWLAAPCSDTPYFGETPREVLEAFQAAESGQPIAPHVETLTQL